jgi:hypothetical protein
VKLGRAWRYFVADYPWAVRARIGSVRERPVPPGYAEGALAPVLLLPGVYETWHFLRAVADRLSAEGHPIVALPELGINRRPIAETASLVWSEVVRRDLRDVVIVAHSKGGLVGKHLLAIDDTEQRIDRMVAVATPFSGSRLATIAPNPALRAFRPRNPLIRSLGEERAVNARITSVYPVIDPHIPEGSRLDGARNVMVRVGGHFAPISHPRGVEAVVAEVDRPGSAPRPADVGRGD